MSTHLAEISKGYGSKPFWHVSDNYLTSQNGNRTTISKQWPSSPISPIKTNWALGKKNHTNLQHWHKSVQHLWFWRERPQRKGSSWRQNLELRPLALKCAHHQAYPPSHSLEAPVNNLISRVNSTKPAMATSSVFQGTVIISRKNTWHVKPRMASEGLMNI